MNGLVSIYGLVCPITLQIKYVGKTIQKLDRRLSMHIRQKGKSKKSIWVQHLLLNSQKPNIILLQECEMFEWKKYEQLWIDRYKNNELMNQVNSGGGGNSNKINYINLFDQYLLKNKSNSTYKNYRSYTYKFLFHFNSIYSNPKNINRNQIESYLNSIQNKNSRNVTLSCLKLFYKEIINQPKKISNISYEYSHLSKIPLPL